MELTPDLAPLPEVEDGNDDTLSMGDSVTSLGGSPSSRTGLNEIPWRVRNLRSLRLSAQRASRVMKEQLEEQDQKASLPTPSRIRSLSGVQHRARGNSMRTADERRSVLMAHSVLD